MNYATIGLICTVIGAIIGIWGFIRYTKRDTKEETRSFTRVETKIDIMGGDIKDIKTKFDIQAEKNSDLEQRITRVEESAKSAHHRLDEHIKENKE